MAALASYARQAEDGTLLHHAMRIQGRAVRRAGELLKEIEPANGVRTDLGRATTRGSAAAEAGMTEHQRKTALRVANIPPDDFESAVESDAPPTVTALAEMGRRPRPSPGPGGRSSPRHCPVQPRISPRQATRRRERAGGLRGCPHGCQLEAKRVHHLRDGRELGVALAAQRPVTPADPGRGESGARRCADPHPQVAVGLISGPLTFRRAIS
jgi:hypothetical protein